MFGDPTTKREFEALFPTAKVVYNLERSKRKNNNIYLQDFAYFPSFSRIRVQFAESIDACRARVRFHLYDFHGARFRAYLTNHVDSNTEGTAAMDFLKVNYLNFKTFPYMIYLAPQTWKTIFDITTAVTSRRMGASARR